MEVRPYAGAVSPFILMDADHAFLGALQSSLAARGLRAEAFTSVQPGLEWLARRDAVRAVVTGLRFPDWGREEPLVSALQRVRCPLSVILVADPESVEEAILTVHREGAAIYFLKPFAVRDLERALRRLLDEPRPATVAASRGGGGGAHGPLGGLVGEHPLIQQLCRLIRTVGQLRRGANVLLRGESGTGKELVARAIHELSAGPDRPFTAVNCGAFSRSLLDDQLFGHRRGAFTGATGDKPGVFAAAGDGTLFLDEITELDLDLQVKLLRAIQEREYYPLGSDVPVTWDARLVVATNRNVEAEVERGTFRQDLFYRLNVFRLDLPSLRERIEDVPLLCDHFLDVFSRARNGRRKELSREALELLCCYAYPGNVRELRNALERAWTFSRGSRIEAADLPPELREPVMRSFEPLNRIERSHIVTALRLARGNKVQAARLLEIDRNRLYRMIRKHDIGATDLK